MLSFLGDNLAIVGANTSGKPVGQSAFDRSECDDRLRPVTFQTTNADGEGNYFNGLADAVSMTCRAADDFSTPLGDPMKLQSALRSISLPDVRVLSAFAGSTNRSRSVQSAPTSGASAAAGSMQ